MPEQRLEDAWLPLRESRAELLMALDQAVPHHARDEFPRSRLFQSLLHQKGAMLLLALAIALWTVNPRLAARLARRVPLRLLVARLFPLLRY